VLLKLVKCIFKADNRGTIGKRVLLDTRKLSNYCYGALISPDCRLLAFIEQDCSGADESGTLRVKDLTSDKILADRIPGVVSFVWHQSRDYSTNNNDNYRLLYTTVNRQLRTDRVLLHTVSSSPHNDQLIFTEPDERFFVDLNLTKDGVNATALFSFIVVKLFRNSH
jgi:oligopeptidase B